MSGYASALLLALAVAWLGRMPALDGGALAALLTLEVAGVAVDTLGFRAVLGAEAKRVRTRSWIRSVAASCAARSVLPFGRPLGEVLRAGALAGDLGRMRAAQVCAHFQIAVLAADVVGAVVLASTVSAREQLVAIAREGPVTYATSSVLLAAAVLAAAAALALFVLVRWVAPEALPIGSSTSTAALHRVLGGGIRTAQWMVVLGAASEPASLGDALTQQGIAFASVIAGPCGELAGSARYLEAASVVVAAACLAAILATTREAI